MSSDTTTTGGTRVEVDLADRIQEIEQERDDVDDPATDRALEHAIELLEADSQRFDGSTFTIKKFRAGETAQVNDLVLQDTLRDDLDDPRAKLSARKLRTVQVGVVEMPPEAPEDPQRFENPTLEYLWECIDNLNTYGEVSLEDF